MHVRHVLLVAASSLALSLSSPVWGARGGYRAAPAGPRATERPYPRGDYHHGAYRPVVILPYWGSGYYDAPYWWYDAGYPDYGTESTAIPIPANVQVTSSSDTPWFVQPPTVEWAPSAPSAELARANADLVQAEAALDEARQRVLRLLADRPEYRAALGKATAAEDQIDLLHSRGESSPEKLLSAAQAALQARQQVTQMQNTAVASDPQATQARARFEAAVANRNALQAQSR